MRNLAIRRSLRNIWAGAVATWYNNIDRIRRRRSVQTVQAAMLMIQREEGSNRSNIQMDNASTPPRTRARGAGLEGGSDFHPEPTPPRTRARGAGAA